MINIQRKIGVLLPRARLKALRWMGWLAASKPGNLLVSPIVIAGVIVLCVFCNDVGLWSSRFIGERGGSLLTILLRFICVAIGMAITESCRNLKGLGQSMMVQSNLLATEIKAFEEARVLETSLSRVPCAKETQRKRL